MKTVICVLAMAIALAGTGQAVTTYSQAVTSVTSVTIENSSHAMNSPYFGVRVKNTLGVTQPLSVYSWSINSLTYAATVTFNSAFTGTVYLYGPFTATTTSANDFRPLWGSGTGGYPLVSICSGCTATAFAMRKTGTKYYYSQGVPTLNLNQSSPSVSVRAWLDPTTTKVVFGLDAASGLATCSGACEVRYSITAYPANVVTLGSGTVGAGGTGWASTSDDRPIDFL